MLTDMVTMLSSGCCCHVMTICVVVLDVDECRQTPGLCGNNSVCSNTKGGYECLCKKGYVKSNDKCIGKKFDFLLILT